jgi:hypothetical protein
MVKRIAFLLLLLVAAGYLSATQLQPVPVEIDTSYTFSDDVSLKDARTKIMQWVRESALHKALPVEIAITSLTTDMYVERNKSFDEETARSIFMMSSSAGRFMSEKLLMGNPVFESKNSTYSMELSYKAFILPVEKAYNAALNLQVELSNTLLQDQADFEVVVTANQDGYLYIFDFLADHSVALVYPNLAYQTNNLKQKQAWKQSLTAAADPTRKMTIETLYFVFSTTPISGWESFRTNTSSQDLVFSAGEESFILFQKWLGRSNPAERVEKMAQLHIMSKQ